MSKSNKVPPTPPRGGPSGFSGFAIGASEWVGSAPAFYLAIASMVAWVVSGFFLHFSENWQLVANTATNVITFVIVFLIQSTQNRDAKAIHLKLDEMIRAQEAASDEMIDVEKLSDEELERLAEHYQRIRAEAERRRGGEAA